MSRKKIYSLNEYEPSKFNLFSIKVKFLSITIPIEQKSVMALHFNVWTELVLQKPHLLQLKSNFKPAHKSWLTSSCYLSLSNLIEPEHIFRFPFSTLPSICSLTGRGTSWSWSCDMISRVMWPSCCLISLLIFHCQPRRPRLETCCSWFHRFELGAFACVFALHLVSKRTYPVPFEASVRPN